MRMHRPISIGLACLSILGCVADTASQEDERTANTEQPINGPTETPQQWMFDRAAFMGNCTGTRIASRFVLTALHCLPTGPTVTFYSSGPGVDNSRTAQVVATYIRPGTDPATNDLDDINGDFADIAVVQLDHDIHFGAAATLAWTYPGPGVWGYKVGAGQHDGNPNPDADLLAVQDTTDSDDDSGGAFRTRHVRVDSGDSGGPFYVGDRVLGTLWGVYGIYARHTGVPHHLDWILDKIGYQWSGGPVIAGRGLTGNAYQIFTGTETACQYACEHVGACLGYDYVPGTSSCTLLSTITGTAASPGMFYAVRWARGGGSSHVGDPVAYRRSDNHSAVVRRASVSGLHELYSIPAGNGWATGALTATLTGRPSAYVRADGTNAVVFRSPSNSHVFELALGAGWNLTDLTSTQGAPLAAGDPAAYVRADGVSAIVYRTSSNHIVELTRPTSTWLSNDLTQVSGAPLASGEPSTFVRSDGYSSVIYRASDGHIWEIYRSLAGTLAFGDPFGLAGTAAAAVGTPFGYVRHDGANAIVYRGADNKVHELRNTNAGWQRADLDYPGAQVPASDPVAYVRSDGYSAVVYRSTTNRIVEVSLGGASGWTAADLTSWGGAAPVGDPYAYVRDDGINSVVYRSSDSHVRELALTGPGWSAWDLTVAAGETP